MLVLKKSRSSKFIFLLILYSNNNNNNNLYSFPLSQCNNMGIVKQKKKIEKRKKTQHKEHT